MPSAKERRPDAAACPAQAANATSTPSGGSRGDVLAADSRAMPPPSEAHPRDTASSREELAVVAPPATASRANAAGDAASLWARMVTTCKHLSTLDDESLRRAVQAIAEQTSCVDGRPFPAEATEEMATAMAIAMRDAASSTGGHSIASALQTCDQERLRDLEAATERAQQRLHEAEQAAEQVPPPPPRPSPCLKIEMCWHQL